MTLRAIILAYGLREFKRPSILISGRVIADWNCHWSLSPVRFKMKMRTKVRKPIIEKRASLSTDELALCAVITRIVARTIAERQGTQRRGKK
jgi:hypothetical protein